MVNDGCFNLRRCPGEDGAVQSQEKVFLAFDEVQVHRQRTTFEISVVDPRSRLDQSVRRLLVQKFPERATIERWGQVTSAESRE